MVGGVGATLTRTDKTFIVDNSVLKSAVKLFDFSYLCIFQLLEQNWKTIICHISSVHALQSGLNESGPV